MAEFQADHYQLFLGIRAPQWKFPEASWGILSSPHTRVAETRPLGFSAHLLGPRPSRVSGFTSFSSRESIHYHACDLQGQEHIANPGLQAVRCCKLHRNRCRPCLLRSFLLNANNVHPDPGPGNDLHPPRHLGLPAEPRSRSPAGDHQGRWAHLVAVPW